MALKSAGKIVIVTGADSGIGQATAEALAKEGADVAVMFHTDEEGARETARRVEAAGRRALVTQRMLASPPPWKHLHRFVGTSTFRLSWMRTGHRPGQNFTEED